ncbi:MAG: YraN family protein [Acidobacteriota bacterium]
MTPRFLVDRLLQLLRRDRPGPYRGLRGVGQRWERLAEKRLKDEGYRIQARNYRTRTGEIDFIAEENGVLCFIEVKGRSGLRFGAPAEAVTAEKQGRIVRAAELYLSRQRIGSRPCRFDVVSILERDGEAQIAILRGAFEAGRKP